MPHKGSYGSKKPSKVQKAKAMASHKKGKAAKK